MRTSKSESLVSSCLVALVLTAACGGKSETDHATASGGSDSGVGGGGTLDADVADVAPPAGQKILFEVSYENYAWGKALKGVFITADGAVYTYDYYASADAGSYPPSVIFPATEPELEARYGLNPQKTGSVSVSELFSKFALVEPAASGVLLGESNCADAGQHSFLGYLFDAATARYTRVILGVDGDLAEKNTSPAATELVNWLGQFSSGGTSCEFSGAECVGAACNAPPPSCPQGQTASVVNGCWGPCVSVNRCLEVSDCSVCGGGGMACAIGVTGSHHCIQMYCQNVDVCACDFQPPCAGGIGYCALTGTFEVHCGK